MCSETVGVEVAGGTHGRVGHATARVRAPVRGAVAAREAPGRRHQPPAGLHLVRGVHRTWPPRVVLQLQHLGRWVVLPVENLGEFIVLSGEKRRGTTAPSAGWWPTEPECPWRHGPRLRPSTCRPFTSPSPAAPARPRPSSHACLRRRRRLRELLNYLIGSIHFSVLLPFHAFNSEKVDGWPVARLARSLIMLWSIDGRGKFPTTVIIYEAHFIRCSWKNNAWIDSNFLLFTYILKKYFQNIFQVNLLGDNFVIQRMSSN